MAKFTTSTSSTQSQSLSATFSRQSGSTALAGATTLTVWSVASASSCTPAATPTSPTSGFWSAGVTVTAATATGGAPPLRITLKQTERGSQIHVEQLTPPPPLVSGLSHEEIWRKAGRNPDGTPIDQNQLY